MLHINDLTYRIEGRMLFDQATLAINKGYKTGLVGRNGTGKSTLFNLIKGSLSPESGSINLRKGARLGCVDQEVPSNQQSLMNTVLAADTERTALLGESETSSDPARLADIYTRLSDIEAYSAPARAGAILSGLGFSATDQERPCADFSGGWRMRIALAAMLFAKPDLLLLDEPTNYLDVEGAVWLEQHIRAYDGTAFIVSHDRDFLNKAVTHIAHLRGGKLFNYAGVYDQFEAILAEQQRLSNAMRTKQDDERRHLEDFVNRFKAKASKARQAQSRVKRLEKMRPVATIINDPIPAIELPSPQKHLSPPIIRFNEADIGYETGKAVLRGLNQRIDPDDRIGILGKNGEGKSTFVKALMGILQPQSGSIRRHKKMQIGYFAQHQIDSLNPRHSAYDHICELMPEATEAQRRARLARFGLGVENAETPASDLSGGEKARLLFSLISFHSPHILVLDEPANHLDMDSRAELIKSLNGYDGAIIIISHDRNLLESVVDRLWLVDKGRVQSYDGTLEDYRQSQLERHRPKKKTGKTATDSRAEARKDSASIRAALAPLKKRAQSFERKIESIKAQIGKIETAMAKPDFFTTDTANTAQISQQYGQLKKQLEQTENDWLEALEIYEAAQAAQI